MHFKGEKLRFLLCAFFIAHPLLRMYNEDEEKDMKTISEARKELGLTQVEAAKALNISRRKLQNYEAMESEENYLDNSIYEEILKQISDYVVDETHGFVTFYQIKHAANLVFGKHEQVKCAYLFGSYARGEQTEKSDVDIFVVVKGPMGMEYYGMAADLSEILHKQIDLVSLNQVVGSEPFLERLLREGVKIYG